MVREQFPEINQKLIPNNMDSLHIDQLFVSYDLATKTQRSFFLILSFFLLLSPNKKGVTESFSHLRVEGNKRQPRLRKVRNVGGSMYGIFPLQKNPYKNQPFRCHTHGSYGNVVNILKFTSPQKKSRRKWGWIVGVGELSVVFFFLSSPPQWNEKMGCGCYVRLFFGCT